MSSFNLVIIWQPVAATDASLAGFFKRDATAWAALVFRSAPSAALAATSSCLLPILLFVLQVEKVQ